MIAPAELNGAQAARRTFSVINTDDAPDGSWRESLSTLPSR